MERKPRILLLSDVSNWAWANKSRQLIKYLSDEFDIDVVHMLESSNGFNPHKYDIYLSYGWTFRFDNRIPKNRRVGGVTAHKPFDFYQGKIMGPLLDMGWHHANSILLKEELEKQFKPVYYVPNGVDEEQFKIETPIPETRDNLIVGHVGKKCGQGTDAKGHKRFIEPACSAAGVIYKGHYNNYKNQVPHNKMPEFYQDIDVFIVASETDGTPNGALEAAACGRPIIANRIGNMPEFIKDGYNGFLVPREVNAYVEKLKWFKNNRDKLIEMGLNARKTVEESWTWKIMAENYRKLFRDIIETTGLRAT